MTPARVSVIVVSFNTKEKLRRCLGCIEEEHEIIVVDNASSDGSADIVRDEFPAVRLIENPGNAGFGVANNQGAEVATGDWILYLNSDAYAEPGAISTLAAECNVAQAVGGGAMLLNPDGSLQESVAKRLTLGHVFLEQTLLEPILRRMGLGYWETKAALGRAENEGGNAAVAQVMGACLMVRRDLDLRFDERFFLYCEDTELCRRLSHHGEIIYVPSARFTHELGSSSSSMRWLSVARYNLGKELYFRIHGGVVASKICWLFNRLGALLRLVAWALIGVAKPAARDKARLFFRVLTASGDLRPQSSSASGINSPLGADS